MSGVRQAITPELRQWIVQQAVAGQSADATLRAMLASGWAEDVAIEAMENALREHLEGEARVRGLPPAVPVPEPALEGAPVSVTAFDRRVQVQMELHEPRIVVFGNVLSPEECEDLIALARPRLARSLTVATRSGGEEVNADRTSNGMFFRRGETELIERIERRLAALVNWPQENGEGLQVLHYRPGTEYKPHYDYFDPDEPGTPTILRRGGQRVATVVLYLAEPEQGGGTVFPDLRLQVAPQRGSAVFFSYPRAHPSSRTLHGGAPVLAGEKWIATKWLRERRFE